MNIANLKSKVIEQACESLERNGLDKNRALRKLFRAATESVQNTDELSGALQDLQLVVMQFPVSNATVQITRELTQLRGKIKDLHL